VYHTNILQNECLWLQAEMEAEEHNLVSPSEKVMY